MTKTTNEEKPHLDTKTMKAVQGKDYGDIDEMISVQDDVPRPSLDDIPVKKRHNYLLIKVYAVSLACGDVRVLSGRTRELQGPPSMPYVPGGDCSGIVEAVPEPKRPDETPYFQVGDRVTARFMEKPAGALGEYAIIHQAVCEKIPQGITFNDAAALASASPAVLLADRIQPGERVLVLGAGGGVGSHFVQLLRDKDGPDCFVVGVSRNPDRLMRSPLCCDAAVDYTQQDVFTMEEYVEKPFDVIVDLSAGGWLHLLQDMDCGRKSIVKPACEGGRYITTTPDTPVFDGHSVWQILNVFAFPSLYRAIQSRLWRRRRLSKYTFAMVLSEDRSVVTRMLDAVKRNKLKTEIDSKGPFPFTTEGVRAAFRLQESRHIEGKVVIQVREE